MMVYDHLQRAPRDLLERCMWLPRDSAWELFDIRAAIRALGDAAARQMEWETVVELLRDRAPAAASAGWYLLAAMAIETRADWHWELGIVGETAIVVFRVTGQEPEGFPIDDLGERHAFVLAQLPRAPTAVLYHIDRGPGSARSGAEGEGA